jgi:pSer/pThr/pTyr-binding forkhead associated (FHA) protein
MTTSLPATNGPVLRFHPVEGSEPFAEKQLPLASGERVKIGRQCNDATEAKADNGFFDTKVLSRQHAEVWADGLQVRRPSHVRSRERDIETCSQIFIKDTKSFNGTYVNGKRLSDEAVESAPVELKSGDVVVITHCFFTATAPYLTARCAGVRD